MKSFFPANKKKENCLLAPNIAVEKFIISVILRKGF